MTGQRDDDARCWDCGHPWDTDCGCTCCCEGELILCGGLRYGLRNRLVRHAPGCPEQIRSDPAEAGWAYRGNTLGWISGECYAANSDWGVPDAV